MIFLIQSLSMLKSMTAYGRAHVVSPLANITVEIQSVNRKHLEINPSLPTEFLRFDADLKKWISAVVTRGQVNVRVTVYFEKTSPVAVLPNVALGLQIKKAWLELAGILSLKMDETALIRVLSKEEKILLYGEELQDEKGCKELFHQTVNQALNHLSLMKDQEGRALYEDISGRIDSLFQAIESIAEKAPGATARYQEKLKERMQEAMGISIENEERILREVCIYADKIDITEEITRFHSHLEQMQLLLKSEKHAIGKTLEFLIQELNREINTIGSKSSDVEVSRTVIQIKTELERIREQIQNVE